jgi:hypothetical protein
MKVGLVFLQRQYNVNLSLSSDDLMQMWSLESVIERQRCLVTVGEGLEDNGTPSPPFAFLDNPFLLTLPLSHRLVNNNSSAWRDISSEEGEEEEYTSSDDEYSVFVVQEPILYPAKKPSG